MTGRSPVVSPRSPGGPDRRPAVTAVVPTHDRPESLARCLAALEAQSPEPLEILVVDDGSREREEVARVVAGAPRARLLAGAGAGPAAARNAGARAARAPLVCFTDDDCEPAAGWASRLVAALEAGADAAVGPTVNARPDDPLAAASQRLTNHLSESSLDEASGRIRFGPSSNLACRTDLLAVLPFDESFPLAAGEDRDWCARLSERRGPPVFVPGAVVLHRQRLSLAGFWRQQLRYGRGAYRFRQRPEWRSLEPPAFYLRLLRRSLAESWRVGALVGLAQVAVAVGFAREALRHRAGGEALWDRAGGGAGR